jgi:hypothetical protein
MSEGEKAVNLPGANHEEMLLDLVVAHAPQRFLSQTIGKIRIFGPMTFRCRQLPPRLQT